MLEDERWNGYGEGEEF